MAKPTAKDPNDFEAALGLAQRMLSKQNPTMRLLSPTVDMRANITQMAMEFAHQGRNLSSLSTDDWMSLLTQQGMSPEVALQMIEEIAAWGVNDRIE